jgi:uncharacterized protein YjdB
VGASLLVAASLSAKIWYVAPGLAPVVASIRDGRSWEQATRLDAALDSASRDPSSTDTIRLKSGDYFFEAPSYRITCSLTLQGGFSGSGTERSGETRLRQGCNARVLVIQGKTYVDSIDVHIENISLEEGDAGKEDGLVINGIVVPLYKGGILYNRYAHTTLTNVRITNGIASAPSALLAYGGGIYNEDGSIVLRDVTLTGNKASTAGGAVANAGGVVYLEGANVFKDNTAWRGGGIALLANGLLYRRSGTLRLSYSDFYAAPKSMDPTALRASLFRSPSDVLLEESPFTPIENFPFFHTLSLSQWNPSGANKGVGWRVGKEGMEILTPKANFTVLEGTDFSFRLTLNGTTVPSENLPVTAGPSRIASRTLYSDKNNDYLYTIYVTKDDSVFAMPEPDSVTLTLESHQDSVYLLSLTDDGGNVRLVRTGEPVKFCRHTALRLSTKSARLQFPSQDIRTVLYTAAEIGEREYPLPIFLDNGITAFDFVMSGNLVVKAYLPAYTSSVNSLLRIDSFTVRRQNGSIIEKPPFLRPLIAGVDNSVVFHVTTGSQPYPYQWEVSLRGKGPEGTGGFSMTTDAKTKLPTLQVPNKGGEIEVIVSLVAYPQIRDSFTVRVYDLEFDTAIRVKKGVKTPLPIISGTEGAILWNVPSEWSNAVSFSGDSIMVDRVGKVNKVTGNYTVYGYDTENPVKVEIDVVDLWISQIETKDGVVTKKDVTDTNHEMLIGQACAFTDTLLFEQTGYKGTSEVVWELISPEEGTVVFQSNRNGVVLTGLKQGFVTLKASLKDELLPKNIPPVTSTVVVHVGAGFGSGGIKGVPLIRYHDCVLVEADIELASGGDLEWTSDDPSVISVDPIGGNQAILSATGYGEAVISVSLDSTRRINKVFRSVGLVCENKGLSDVAIPVSPGDVLSLPCHLLSKEEGDHIIWTTNPSGRASATGGKLYFNPLSSGGSYGDVTVTATAFSSSEIRETFTYKVIGFSLDKDTIELNYDNGSASITRTLSCELSGANTESVRLMWKLLDTTVVQMETLSNREVLLRLPLPPRKEGGETTVIVFCVDNPSLQASCVVKSKQIVPSSLTIKPTSGPYLTGEVYHFEASIEDWGSVDPSERVGWRTFEPEVIRVMPSSKGVWVQPLIPGTATLQVYLLGEPEGPVANFPLVTSSASAGIYLKESFVSMREYATYALEYASYPNDLATVSIEWVSSNPKVVDVMPYVTPRGEPRVMLISYLSGEAEITGTIKDVFGNEYTSSCVVQVLTPVESLTLESTNRVLWKGETYALNVKVYPPPASHSNNIKYESLDKQIATVDAYGIVTAVGVGKAIIKASVPGESKVAYCYVTVAEPSSVGVVVIPNNLSLLRSQTYLLSVMVNPYADATSLSGVEPIEWTSSNKSVATVTSNGNVLALSEGVTYIRATTADGWNSQECLVQVKVPPLSLIPPEGVSLISGNSEPLKDRWEIFPPDATIASRPDWGVWEVSDESVVEIDEFGTVLAKSAGTTLVTATIQGFPSLKASSIVTVAPPYNGLSLSRNTLTLRKGEMSVLTAMGADGYVDWQSSDEDVVSVDNNGNIVGKDVGTAVITASDLHESMSCVVTVGVYAEALFITPYEPSYMKVGDHFTMTATVIPQEAKSESLLWSETNSSLLKLTRQGNSCTIEALRPGTSVLYVASPDGRAYRSWVIQIGNQTSFEEFGETFPPLVSYKEGTLLLRNLEDYTVTVWTLSGRTPVHFETLSEEVSLSIPLPTGVYILRAVHRDGGLYTVKFMAP